MNIVIIPARKNSKRIKNKNIKKFYGKPIIEWTINILLKSKIFDRIIVSTDSKKIAKIALKCGAEVPFFRPKILSNDYSSTTEVVEHALSKLDNILKNDYICCVYPTSVLVRVADLKKGLKAIINNKFIYVFSATKDKKSVLRSFFYNRQRKITLIKKNHINKRTQDLPDTYFDAALFYWAKSKDWTNKKNIFSKKSSFIHIPHERSQDIDTIDDWREVEKKYLKYGEIKII